MKATWLPTKAHAVYFRIKVLRIISVLTSVLSGVAVSSIKARVGSVGSVVLIYRRTRLQTSDSIPNSVNCYHFRAQCRVRGCLARAVLLGTMRYGVLTLELVSLQLLVVSSSTQRQQPVAPMDRR